MADIVRSLQSITVSAFLAMATAIATSSAVLAEDEIVDVQLVLAADVSLSMSYQELRIQRDGYAAALTHDSVIQAIEDGAYGKIALAMFEWAGDQSHYVVVPWTVIASREDAVAVAGLLSEMTTNSARRTSISGALDFANDLFAESGFRGLRRVVDISGDGPNNQGGPVVEARDRLVEQGIVINGLPLMTNGGGMSTIFDVPDLDSYYSNCVVGGPGSFMIPVNSWEQFPEAIRRKLVLELAGSLPPEWQFQASAPIIRIANDEAFDCLIGEKRWMNRSWNWPPRQ